MLDALFKPRSVAVIGASNRRLTIGYRIIQNLIDHEFNGPIFPVHPKAPFIKNLPAYPTILDVPAEVDLAHIVVKNTYVPQILSDCAQKGVKAVIINTGGFKEIGEQGIKLEQEIQRIAKETGIRVFGPNCQGIMNSDPEVRAYCNFTFTKLTPGRISLIAQSGGVGEVINNRLYELGAGLRMYASNGNACDVSIPEILEYMGDDPETRVIICHVEKLRDPRRFLEVARKVSRKKPILGMKTGRTMAGAKAVSSHTGGLIKKDTTTELVFAEAGVVSFQDQEELCQTALAFAMQPVPRGNRVGIITNTGGPGIISTDCVIEGGCEIPDLSPSSQEKLKEALFAEAIVSNPVDVIATAGPDQYRAAVQALIDDPKIDSILVNFITPFFVDCEGVAREIADLARENPKTLIGIVMTEKQGWASTLKIFRDASIPTYDFPEVGAKALSAMVRYGKLRDRDMGELPSFDNINTKLAEEILSRAANHDRQYLTQADGMALLSAYGIQTPKCREANDLSGVLNAAKDIGYPVVLKAESDDIVHKSDAGGVALHLVDEAAVRGAYERMSESLTRNLTDPKPNRQPHRQVSPRMIRQNAGGELAGKQPGFLVAEHKSAGQEIILGAKHEPGLGSVVMFGLGGIFVEVLEDVAFGLAPLSRTRAMQLIAGTKGYKLLRGVRGVAARDLHGLADMICRFSVLVSQHPQILEIDLNPVFVYEQGQSPCAVDVRIKVK